MPPRKKQPERQIQQTQLQTVPADLIVKRTKRHLDELERSNYAEPGVIGEEETSGAKGRARDIISDRRPGPGVSGKRKSTLNVRGALLYKKNLSQLIEESGLPALPAGTPSYLTAVAPPPKVPPRVLCSVCGYWGKYKCRRCAMPYCDLSCQATHNDTRCEKRVI
ncbi:hypothetical protein Clacol_002488 [Clathrus columnatus]|uniref:HIT-type domain-containing protein n=1 Tax=Clathrus columnatus TaxID=1419009 RepID=A0AAV5A6L9_9AGAM|nr:hypothetical protein Clacol_002488 [Clathrus columnatus]